MLRNNRLSWFLCLGLLLLASTIQAQTGCGRLYVDSAVTTSGNGSSWATAFKTVTQALDSANNGTCSSREIWVAKGTYRPMASTTLVASSRDSSFRILRNGIKLYGGFAGGETTLSARNVATNLTVLSGDIGVAGDSTDDSHHVVTVLSNNPLNYIDSNTRIDGFTVNRGNATITGTTGVTFGIAGQATERTKGGGMYSYFASPTIANCTFSQNNSDNGGGMYIYFASPPIVNCTFFSNSANGSGGGIHSDYSLSSISNCTFSFNSAGVSNISGTGGGGIYNTGYNSNSISVTNCTFSFNTAVTGGGMRNENSSPSITNCTFSSNKATYFVSGFNSGGGGMYNHGGSPSITKCLFSLNTTVGFGGGMHNDGSSPSITNCTFSSNATQLSTGYGGGVYNFYSSPLITNNTFSFNSSANGGGICNAYTSPSIVNCTFSHNTSVNGGGMNNLGSSPAVVNCTFYSNSCSYQGGGIYNSGVSAGAFPFVTNCILWGNISPSGGAADIYNFNAPNSAGSNSTVSYSTTQVPQTGTGNSTANPLFLNTANLIGPDGIWRTADDGLQLQGGSPAINAGDNSAIPTGITTDIMDSLRIRQITVDMGAYEFIPFTCPAGPVVYVDSSRTLTGNGSSWANAYKTLSEGLYAANNCAAVTQVWVAKGTYYPMASRTAVAGSRDSSFRMLRNGIKVYGGFAGGETALSARNIATNPTVLSGDIGIVNDSTDNCYHVVTVVSSNAIDTNTCLDGFTVRRGNANGGATPFVVAGSNLSRYAGGGLYNASSAPLITACIFTSNSGVEGGGMHNALSSPFIKSCTFAFNRSIKGGGIYNASALPTVSSCLFFSNSSDSSGGGLYNASSTPQITNATFFSNSSSNGGGISNDNSSPQIANCILWGNSSGGGPSISNSGISSPVINYSTTETVQPGAGNSTANPLFVNAGNAIGPDGIWGTGDDGLRLISCSPAINTGNNAAVPASITTDITGAIRIQNTTVDKGAYEMPYNSTGISVTTVSRNAANPVCSNTVITFTATTTVPGSLPTYQWYKNGVAVGSNQPTYTANSWSNGDSVWVLHTNNNCSVADTSAKSIIQLAPVPAFTGAIAGNSSPCPGTQTYSIGAVAGATTYTWTVPAGWIITAGQGTTSITVTSTNASGTITVLAGNACLTAPSASTLVVTSFTTPVLPTGPSSVCGSSTGNVWSIPPVVGATSYLWTVPAGWVITAGQGTNSITVTAAAGNTSGNISVQASNVCPTSGGAPLAVSGGSVTPSLLVGSNSGSTICAGASVIFTATPFNGGTAPAYQWKKNGSNVGTNTPTYSDNTLATGDAITVTLTSNSPCATVATVTASGPPLAVVPNVMPTISINGPSGLALCAGTIATFTTSSTAGGPTPTYKWYKNGIAIAGQTASSYTGFGFVSGDSVWVAFAPTVACRLADTVHSTGVKLTVNPNIVPVLTVTASPGTSVPAGSLVTFTANVTAGGSNATYQWLKNGAAIAGATASTYITNSLQSGDMITVRVAALGPCANPNTLTSTPLRISDPARLQTVSRGAESISLYPNPNSGRFTVSADWGTISTGEKVQLEVLNNLGQVVWSSSAALTAGKWNVEVQLEAGVANGLYLLRVQRQKDGSRVTKPLLIQR